MLKPLALKLSASLIICAKLSILSDGMDSAIIMDSAKKYKEKKDRLTKIVVQLD